MEARRASSPQVFLRELYILAAPFPPRRSVPVPLSSGPGAPQTGERELDPSGPWMSARGDGPEAAGESLLQQANCAQVTAPLTWVSKDQTSQTFLRTWLTQPCEPHIPLSPLWLQPHRPPTSSSKRLLPASGPSPCGRLRRCLLEEALPDTPRQIEPPIPPSYLFPFDP